MLTTIDLPVVSHVTRASVRDPFLGLMLTLDVRGILQLAAEMDAPRRQQDYAYRSISIEILDADLLDALLRLVKLLEEPALVPRLAPLVQQVRVAIDGLRQRMEVLPGVTRAALVSRLPAQQSGTTTTEVEGYTPPAGTGGVELPFALVTDGYFETMGIALLQGRLFNNDDVPGGDGVSIVVNQTAARRFWGNANPIGRRMRAQGSQAWSRMVVGVVADAPVARLGESPRPMFYRSTRQTSAMPSYVVARTEGDPSAILATMRRELSALHPTAVIDEQSTLAVHFGATLSTPRLIAGAMGAFSALALLLAGLGIYAVVSFSVARRTSELAIRMALGAERAGVVRMVVREVARVVVAGMVAGLAVSALAAPRLGGMLYGVSALDPLTFGGAVIVLLGVSAIAAFVPARRAAGADPMEALRVS